MNFGHATHDAEHESSRFHVGDNIAGALVIIVGSAVMVGLAWGAMVLLTSPDGWVTKAANSALAGEAAQHVSFAEDQ